MIILELITVARETGFADWLKPIRAHPGHGAGICLPQSTGRIFREKIKIRVLLSTGREKEPL